MDWSQAKSALSKRFGAVVKQRGWVQREVAELLGIPRPAISNLTRGLNSAYNTTSLLEHLVAIGIDVDIVLREPAGRKRARLRVVDECGNTQAHASSAKPSDEGRQ